MKGFKKCLKKTTLIPILSLFSVLFSVFFVSSCFATTVDCGSFTTFPVDISSCDTSSLDSSKDWYYSGSYTISNSFTLPNRSLIFNNLGNTNTNAPYSQQIVANLNGSNLSFPLVHEFYIVDYYTKCVSISHNYCKHYYYIHNQGYFDSVTLKISDSSFSECPSCPSCPPVPVIPENPYDTKFDNIETAIYTCGAIIIVLYFFYCIYRMIIKSTGGK